MRLAAAIAALIVSASASVAAVSCAHPSTLQTVAIAPVPVSTTPPATPRPTKSVVSHQVVSRPRRTPVANLAVWLRIAKCESSSRWDLVDPPYAGGLQFMASSWSSMHGNEFAPTADRATPRQQMIVANRLLAVQGWGAWPVCSIVAGAR